MNKTETITLSENHPKSADSFLRAMSLRDTGLYCVILYGLLAVFFGRFAFSGNRVLIECFLWATLPALIWLYCAGMRSLRESSADQLRVIITGAALSAVTAACIVPFDSMDIFAYINAGWLQSHYGLNPYVSVVGDVPAWQAQPMFSPCFANVVFMYGFVFASICKWICQLGNGSLLFTLVLFKIANLLAYGLSGLLIYAGAKALKLSRPDLSLYLFLWNPLILLHIIGNGHNDIFTVLFLLLALYLIIIDRWLWVLTTLACSVLIKFMSLIIVPFILLYCIRKQRVTRAALGLVPACLVLWLICPLYLAGFSHFRFDMIFGQFSDTSGCLYQSLSETYVMLGHLIPWMKQWTDGVKILLQVVLTAVYILIYGITFYRAAKGPDLSISKMMSMILVFSMLLFCAASATFFPWYLTMLLPLALLIDRGSWLRELAVSLTLFHTLSFTGLEQAHVLNYAIMVLLPVGLAIRRYDLLSELRTKIDSYRWRKNGMVREPSADVFPGSLTEDFE